MKAVAIVDYGRGNLRSVHKALESVGLRVTITSKPQDVLDAAAVVLPGVGAFRDCMDNLERLGLIHPLLHSLREGKPFLGLCLGLQILFTESEEFGTSPGLGLFPGRVRRFPQFDSDGEIVKIPHMGWNTIRMRRPCPLFDGLPEAPYFYFLHSYFVVPDDAALTVAESEYGVPFTCAIQHENVLALQFHPEKSQRAGLAVLRNFGKVVGQCSN